MSRFLPVLLLITICGCAGPEYKIHESRDDARAIKTLSGPAAGEDLQWHGVGRLSLELKRLEAFSSELSDIAREITGLHRAVGGKKKIEFYSMDEHDRIESMLFRYLVCREALWDIASYYGKRQGLFTSSTDKVKGFILAYNAALKVQYTDTKLVVTFLDEPVTVTKLNAGYARCRIPAGSFDRIFHAVTSVDHLEAMEASWKLFKEEADNPKSKISKVARSDDVYGALVRDIRIQRLYAKAQTDRLLDKTSTLFPNMTNRIRQSKVTELAATTRDAFKTGIGACGSLVGGVTTALIKAPLSTTVQWGLGDLKSMFAAAQPGDIILTVREGYLSNIIIPGEFKHGLTFVGSVSQRRAAGLSKSALAGVPAPVRQRTSEHFFRSRDATGAAANCIEAVSEGVVMSSTRRLTRLAMSKVLILRPVLSPSDRVGQLGAAFSHLEEPYDFKFNFADNSKLCCTESIYRSLNGRGKVAFSLVKRMGIMTLSADDIIRTYFRTLDGDNPMLEFIALAEEVPGSAKHLGRVLTGPEGLERLRVIMNIPAPRADGETVSGLPDAPALRDNDPTQLRLACAAPLSTSPLYTYESINRRSPCSIPSLPSF
ncbi:MAG: hypothetical protein ISS31_05195 [Kiritimatiellae bacterium]|nr:hypothetical protein [Kiritimatiellia bacterium]